MQENFLETLCPGISHGSLQFRVFFYANVLFILCIKMRQMLGCRFKHFFIFVVWWNLTRQNSWTIHFAKKLLTNTHTIKKYHRIFICFNLRLWRIVICEKLSVHIVKVLTTKTCFSRKLLNRLFFLSADLKDLYSWFPQ